ncbi:MAG: deoxyguanosinetriphosphate triphosphohydrolase [Candidatus Zixiibacteriota bacterium]
MIESALTRVEIEERERAILAPYASLSADSRGRVHKQQSHPLRTEFQRDRDRIIHSAAFRRLEYKTQVFIPHEKDHFRTRLTHTIEVAQISRTLARSLRLNEDLTEAIALVHDLGHTPFGHAGEDVLNELLSQSGGFNHNRQSLRIVDLIEQRYPDHPGLNLSYEVREGIARHETSVPMQIAGFPSTLCPTLEASLVDISDEIAYNVHDIDDGLSSGLIDFNSVANAPFSKELLAGNSIVVRDKGTDLARHTLTRSLLNSMATDVIATTMHNLLNLGIDNLEDVRECSDRIVGYSISIASAVAELKRFLHNELYRHPHLESMSDWARKVLEVLFARFMAEPSLLPARYVEMLKSERPEIVIADYIAGMTDRFATEKYTVLG